MAKFKKGDRIRMVEDKDFAVEIEDVAKDGYKVNNRCTVFFGEESDWELDRDIISQCVDCGEEYKNVILHKSNIKESEPSTHEMKVTTQTEWYDVDTFCREHLKLDDGEVAKITIIKFTITK